jgi:hypothetical protein
VLRNVLKLLAQARFEGHAATGENFSNVEFGIGCERARYDWQDPRSDDDGGAVAIHGTSSRKRSAARIHADGAKVA